MLNEKTPKKAIKITPKITKPEKIKRIFNYKTDLILITTKSINFLTKNSEVDFKHNLNFENFSDVKLIKEKSFSFDYYSKFNDFF